VLARVVTRGRPALFVSLALGLALGWTRGAAAAAKEPEPDVADLPPEFAQYVAELRVKVVRESDGRPIPHTALMVDGGNEVFGLWRKKIMTDAAGRAAVRLPVGRYRAYPLADAFAFAWSDFFDLDADVDGNAEVTIPLRPACALAGRVVDDQGKPLAGSRVDVWADAGEIHLVADGAGRFRATRLTAGEHTVTAHSPGFASQTEKGTARAGGARQIPVVLHRGATVTVVTECDGAPCVGASARVYAGYDGGELSVEPDGAAAFRDLPAGPVTISAVRTPDLPGELLAAPIERRLKPGDVVAVKVTLTPSGGRFAVRGSVLDPAGKPFEGAAIWAECGGVRRRLNQVEKDGTFVVRDLPTDRCKIEAAANNQSRTIETHGPAPVRFVIER